MGKNGHKIHELVNTDMRTVSHIFLREYLRGAASKGYNLNYLLGEAGMPGEMHHDPYARIDGVQFNTLARRTGEILDDCFVGWTPQRATRKGMPDFVDALCGQPNLGSAIAKWVEIVNSSEIHPRLVTVQHGNLFTWHLRFKRCIAQDNYPLVIMLKLSRISTLSWMIGREIKISHIGFAAPAPGENDDYNHLVDVPVSFNNDWNSVSFDVKYLSCPIIRTVEETVKYWAGFDRDAFHTPQPKYQHTEQVRDTLLALRHQFGDFPALSRVASELSIGAKSLTRRLEMEGHSFQGIKNDLRRDLALEKINYTDMPLTDIAAELGFSEPATFWRAFRGWTGFAPNQYKHELLNAVQAAGAKPSTFLKKHSWPVMAAQAS